MKSIYAHKDLEELRELLLTKVHYIEEIRLISYVTGKILRKYYNFKFLNFHSNDDDDKSIRYKVDAYMLHHSISAYKSQRFQEFFFNHLYIKDWTSEPCFISVKYNIYALAINEIL